MNRRTERPRVWVTLLALALAGAWPAGLTAAERIPIFDVHIHYSQAAWQQFGTQAVVDLWNQAGIERAIVSSTPDDGTVALRGAVPAPLPGSMEFRQLVRRPAAAGLPA
jgi:hypothetical protein